jgi:hypothetical protein
MHTHTSIRCNGWMDGWMVACWRHSAAQLSHVFSTYSGRTLTQAAAAAAGDTISCVTERTAESNGSEAPLDLCDRASSSLTHDSFKTFLELSLHTLFDCATPAGVYSQLHTMYSNATALGSLRIFLPSLQLCDPTYRRQPPSCGGQRARAHCVGPHTKHLHLARALCR